MTEQMPIPNSGRSRGVEPNGRGTGTRIRDRRMELGLRQGELAEKVGISPSYLNLIEHEKRRIGGKVLIDLARALKVEPATLTEGTDIHLAGALHSAASEAKSKNLAPETDRIDAFAGRFPGWAALLQTQSERIAALQKEVDGLKDRLRHDPVLAETMHDVLSSATAIRSMADILAGDRELDAQWRERFHRNLHEEAERLAEKATGLLHYFDQDAEPGGAS